MNKKIKKIGYRIGIIPIIIALSIGLLAGGVALAQDPEPQSPAEASGGVTPNSVTNDGASVLHFNWHIWDWVGTPDFYTFSIHEFGDPTALYIQRSDTGNLFTGITVALQDISGYSEGQDIYNPEGSGNTHDWTVPDTLEEGSYSAWAFLYTDEKGTDDPEAGAFISFSIEQAEGDLTVIKLDYVPQTPLDNWEFKVYEANTADLVGTGLTGTGGNPTGQYTFEDLPIGDYDVVETIQTDWVCMVPGSSGIMEDVTVPYNGTETVTFENQANVGNLTIIKYADEAGDGSYDGGELLLDGWAFSISGPSSDSGSTSGGGYLEFTGIPVGDDYTVTETIQSHWRCTDPGPSGVMTGVVVSTGLTTEVYFGNQELGDLKIFKYEDLLGDGYDVTDPPAADWGFTVDGMGLYYTDGTGYVTVPDLVPGAYTVTEVSGPAPPPGFVWVCTDPPSGKQKVANVPSGGTDEVQFGNWLEEHRVPTLGQWGIIAMSTVFAALLVWFGVRRRRIA